MIITIRNVYKVSFSFLVCILIIRGQNSLTCRWGKRYYLYMQRNIQIVLINFTWLNRHGSKLVYLCLTWKCHMPMQKVWCIETLNIEIHSAAMEMPSVLQKVCFLPTNSSSKSVDLLWPHNETKTAEILDHKSLSFMVCSGGYL